MKALAVVIVLISVGCVSSDGARQRASRSVAAEEAGMCTAEPVRPEPVPTVVGCAVPR